MEELVLRIQDGDLEAFPILLEKCKRLIGFVAKRFVSTDEDFFQECSMALWKAVRLYDKSRGVPFSHFVCPFFRNEAYKLYNQSKKHLTLSLDRIDRGTGYRLLDDVRSRPEQDVIWSVLRNESIGEIRWAISLLPDHWRRVVLLWMKGKTYKEMSLLIGLSKQRVHQIWQASIYALRDLLKARRNGTVNYPSSSGYKVGRNGPNSQRRRVGGVFVPLPQTAVKSTESG